MSGLLSNLDQLPNPCFVLDEALFEINMKLLNEVDQLPGVSVLCALKGFATWNVFPLMKQYITGATASSANEVRLTNEKLGEKAHACFVVYSEEEFDFVNENSSHLTFNSFSQFNRFNKSLREGGNYAIRINPEFSNVPFEKYNPCMPGSRFGVTKSLLPENLPSAINGLHFHTLCESGAEDFAATLNHIEKVFGNYLHQVDWVNFGGGHHVTRPGYDIKLLKKLLVKIAEQYNVEVFIEPGEAIGLNTGYLVCKVEDIVENGLEKIAVLNVSFAAHMPDCLEMPYKPELVEEVKTGSEFTLGGNTCMSGDFVKGFTLPADLKVGDILTFKDMAHYTTVKTNYFNGVKHPDLGIWNLQNEFKCLREFSYLDFRDKLS